MAMKPSHRGGSMSTRNNKNININQDLMMSSMTHGQSQLGFNTQRMNQNNYIEFTQIGERQTARRPCCNGRHSYVASNHTSLNMSRKSSRRPSR